MICQKCGEWIFLELTDFCPVCKDFLNFKDLTKGGS